MINLLPHIYILCFSLLLHSSNQALAQEKADRKILRDIPYGPQQSQALDLYLPVRNDSLFSLVIVIHGGGFHAGDKASPELVNILKQIQKAGFAAASINYRLLPEQWPAQIEDAYLALCLLGSKADEWKLDIRNIGILGISAGANLGSLLATSFNDTAFTRPHCPSFDSIHLAAVVDLSGVFNYSSLYREMEGQPKRIRSPKEKARELFGEIPESRRKEIETKAGALHYLSAGDPPFLLIHSRKDIVPGKQSEKFLKKAKSQGVSARRLSWKHPGHGADLFDPYHKQIILFFQEHLKNAALTSP